MSETREQLKIKAMGVRHITAKQAKSLGIKKEDFLFTLAESYVDQLSKFSKIGTADKVKSIFSKFGVYLGADVRQWWLSPFSKSNKPDTDSLCFFFCKNFLCSA